jgi:hypothetical protein
MLDRTVVGHIAVSDILPSSTAIASISAVS